MGKVYIGFAHMGMMYYPMFESLLKTIMQDKSQRQVLGDGVLAVEGHYLADQYNAMVRAFLEKDDAEWLLFVEYDHIFDADTLYSLLDSADPVERPIVGGLYFVKVNGKIVPVFYADNKDNMPTPLSGFTTGKLYDICSTGTGFTLVHRSVFEKMKDSYPEPWHWFGHDTAPGVVFGHDVTFFRRARACGFKVFGNTGIILPHIKNYDMNLDAYAAQGDIKVTEHVK